MRRALASLMISRTRGTPSVTALKTSKALSVWRAKSRAKVVLPQPGGPQSTMLPIAPRSIALRKGFPVPSKCSWPRNSSSDCGLSR